MQEWKKIESKTFIYTKGGRDMDIEFHYFITYILCRKAGFDEGDAYKIAYSSQYTDDNEFHYFVNYKDGGHFLNEISQTMDITKPSLKRQKIYPLFHFIPGGKESEETCTLKCGDTKCFVTIPNNENAQMLLKDAFDSGDLYRIGIAIHAFADTWSHQNFIGFKDKANARIGITRLIPNIGHADFFHEPDKIHNEWKDIRLEKRKSIINNDERFLDAAKHIFIYLYRFKNPVSDDDMAALKYEELNLEQQLKDAMDDSYFLGPDDKARIKAYRKICNELKLKKYQYHSNTWRYDAVEKKEMELDLFDKYWAKNNFLESDWYKFQKAVITHRDYALDKFMPLFEKADLIPSFSIS
jgi:hypothetical protein